MPSVEMRRISRVLRSGRRSFAPPVHKGKKYTRAADKQWREHLDNPGDGGGDVVVLHKDGWNASNVASAPKTSNMDIDNQEIGTKLEMQYVPEVATEKEKIDGLWGTVYRRKRKRKKMDPEHLNFLDDDVQCMSLYNRRYGKVYARKRSRRNLGTETCNLKEDSMIREELHCYARYSALLLVVDPSCRGSYWVVSLLYSVLSYMRRARVSVWKLSEFFNSRPIAHVFSSHGLQFLKRSTLISNGGACMIWGVRCSIPVFYVNFSAAPTCFMYFHTTLLLRCAWLPYFPRNHSKSIGMGKETFVDQDHPSVIPHEKDQLGCDEAVPGTDNSVKRELLRQLGCDEAVSGTDNSVKRELSRPVAAVPSLPGKHIQLRTARNIQKRRSSLRSRRGRYPTAFASQKASGALVSHGAVFRHAGARSSSVVSSYQLRSYNHKRSSINIKELKSTVAEVMQDIETASCSANILVIESDKCYREEGAVVMLEICGQNQYSLVVKRDGIKRYSFRAQKDMRPCSSNRFTHAVIWAGDSGWKLEFPNRRDWLVFKQLYKECSERNVQNVSDVESVIPVPWVREISDYMDRSTSSFSRPESYISMKDDELSRALAGKSATYDMDSDDESWVEKYNNETAEKEKLSTESFEFIVGALERGLFCNPDDYSDEKGAPYICADMERKVVEALHSYWMKKRKQKRSALIRVFQCYQLRRTQLIQKTILRKKRSFKRQGSQAGRGKQRLAFQAITTEQDTLDQQKAIARVQEAKAAASKSEGLAVAKRQRAQLLMENADLATYKAMMALRIAEARSNNELAEPLVSLFLG